MPCALDILEETRTITFDYPYDNSATTFIPDNIFEDYLEDLGFGDDIAYNDLVFTNRIENMAIVDFNYVFDYILSLEGINAFKELKILRCQSNAISNLDVSQNLKLEQLWCYNNPITELDVSQNVNLEQLEISENNINTIDISQNVNLETLNVSRNNINTIDVSQNVNLKRLWINENNIENIDISNNIALEWFYCPGNFLTSINTSNNINLRHLYFGLDFITEVDLSDNFLLKRVEILEGQITTLDLSNNPQLEYVGLLYNDNLTSLNLKNGNNANLDHLICWGSEELFCIDVDAPVQDDYPDWHVSDWTIFSEDCSLGIEDILATQIMLYPNPAQNVLHLENSSGYHINSLKIYVVIGRRVFSLNHPTNLLDVSNLKAGLFFVSIKTDQGTLIKKFVKE